MADRETHVANYFETELTTELGPTDLVAEVMSTGGLQSPAFLVIEPDDPNQREVILFDGAFTDTEFRATSITNRYLDGSAQPGGLTHPAGSVVRSAPLAQHIQDLNDRIGADRLRITSLEEATVGTEKLEDGAVTTEKIADQSVTTLKIGHQAVTTAKLANQAVTTSKIADGSVTGEKLSARVPKGVLGYAQVTSGQSGITSMTDLTGLSVTVYIPAGRIIRITGHALIGVSNTRSVAAGWIREGSSTLGRFGTVDNQALAATAFALGHGAAILSSPSPGQHTYKLSLEVTSGSGSASTTASTATPAYILVEDLGADPNA